MPQITNITIQKGRENRRNIHLDGALAFGCNINVVAKFRLREGLCLTSEQVREIELGEVKQECFDRAVAFLERRLHSRAELFRKLTRREYGSIVIEAVLDDLGRLGYVSDEHFARTKALAAATHKQHGRRRAFVELLKSGVSGEVANRALDDVYATTDGVAVARQLAQKQAPRLAKLDAVVARRRLAGMLQRRGFDYDAIKPVIDEVLRSQTGTSGASRGANAECPQ